MSVRAWIALMLLLFIPLGYLAGHVLVWSAT